MTPSELSNLTWTLGHNRRHTIASLVILRKQLLSAGPEHTYKRLLYQLL